MFRVSNVSGPCLAVNEVASRGIFKNGESNTYTGHM